MWKIIITIIITAILSGLISYTYTIKSIQSYKTPTIQPTIINNNKAVKLHQDKILSSITPSNRIFSVELLTKPTISLVGKNYHINFSVRLKNISVKPFITGFDLADCNYSDNKNNLYQYSSWSLSSGIKTRLSEKALLPNEEADIDWDFGFNAEKCDYDDKGYKICRILEGIKLIDCNAWVTSNSNYIREKDPVNVKFTN